MEKKCLIGKKLSGAAARTGNLKTEKILTNKIMQ